jgi:hypothetical protein
MCYILYIYLFTVDRVGKYVLHFAHVKSFEFNNLLCQHALKVVWYLNCEHLSNITLWGESVMILMLMQRTFFGEDHGI